MTTEISRWVSSDPEQQWSDRTASAFDAREASLRLSGSRHQTWRGAGGCFNELGWKALALLAEQDRARVVASLFDPTDGCRFNLCRLPIGASDYAAEWYSLDEVDGDCAMEHFTIARDEGCLIPYIKSALAHRPDATLFASPWSPPTWMKFPKAYNYGMLVQRRELLDAYALYFVKFVQAYAARGVTIRQVHPQNEPAADQKFPSCLWTGVQMRDFIKNHLGPAFERHALECEIWLGTINSDDYDGWANTVLGDPAARRYVAGVGYQWAGKGAIQRTRESWDVELMQTENECGDGTNSWEYARYVFGLMRHYVTNGAGAYVYWNMILEDGGRSTWGWRQNSLITVDPQARRATCRPEFYVMKHLSAFVDPGAVNLGLSGPWTANAFAFANPSGRTVVCVMNPFAGEREFAFDTGTGIVGARLGAFSINTFVFE
jgi:glucosylceramidase